jgi:hypothetical protein
MSMIFLSVNIGKFLIRTKVVQVLVVLAHDVTYLDIDKPFLGAAIVEVKEVVWLHILQS